MKPALCGLRLNKLRRCTILIAALATGVAYASDARWHSAAAAGQEPSEHNRESAQSDARLPLSSLGEKLTGVCLVLVGHREYMNGPCTAIGGEYRTDDQYYMVLESGAFLASVTSSVSDGRAKWFADYSVRRKRTFFTRKLGVLERHGPCWTSPRSKICFEEVAWRR